MTWKNIFSVAARLSILGYLQIHITKKETNKIFKKLKLVLMLLPKEKKRIYHDMYCGD